MKKTFKFVTPFGVIISIILLFSSCVDNKPSKHIAENIDLNINTEIKETAQQLSDDFKKYWYSGEAEITSYRLEQVRYGEIRDGHAVLIYVTEDFSPKLQVKADQKKPENISVLKLNTIKKFNTGIYPYSVMQSAFYPVSNNQHAIKVSLSMQEWCGHVYVQLNNRDDFEIKSHSYFQSDADKSFNLDKVILENELWTQLRIDPKQLPTGNLQIIPSFEYMRFIHLSFQSYNAIVKLTDNSYTIFYPDLNRTLTINFNSEFPYDIYGWEETYKGGPRSKTKFLTTKATKLVTIKSPYWGKNRNKDSILRKTLQLK